MEFVTNNNGIRFKVCCASCENRVLEVANMMLEITEKVTEVAAADAEVTNETTEE